LVDKYFNCPVEFIQDLAQLVDDYLLLYKSGFRPAQAVCRERVELLVGFWEVINQSGNTVCN